MRSALTWLGLFLLAGCGGGGGPATASPGAGVLLRMTPPEGQVSQYKFVSETTTEMEGMPGMDSGVTLGQTMFVTNRVLEVSDTLWTFSQVIDSVEVDAPAIMSMMTKTMEGVEGLTMTLVMTSRGEVISSETEGEDLDPTLEAAFDAATEAMGGLSIELPEGPMFPGDSWTVPVEKTMSMAGMGEMLLTGEMTYVLERTEERDDGTYAILSLSGNTSQGIEGEPSSEMGLSMTTTGDSVGEVHIHLDEGRQVSMTMTMTSVGTMSIMGRDITTNSTMFVSQTLLGG